MVRSILRNVQNSLMLGALALCILAFQRLSRLSTIGVHKAPSSLWPYPPPPDSSRYYSQEDEHDSSFLRIGSHHELIFGREIRIGLFRFVLPVLKKYPKSLLNDSYNSKESDDKEKKLRGKNKERKITNRLAILISIGDCREETIDDSAVLIQSLPDESDIQAYASMNNDKYIQQCGDTIAKQGYELLSASKLQKDLPASCLSDEESLLLIAHSLQMDTVVHVPLPAIVSTHEHDSPVPMLTEGLSHAKMKRSIKAMNGKAPTNITSIVTIQPQGPKVVQGLLDDSNKEYCEKEKIGNRTKSLAMDSLVPWSPCNHRDEGSCRISESLLIATLSHCPLPLFNQVNNSTDSFESQNCQRLRNKWLDTKDSLLVNRKVNLRSSRF